jgi:hypothetical protein
MEEFIVLVLLLGIALAYIYHTSNLSDTSNTAGFEDGALSDSQVSLSACPSDMKTFYLPDSRTACCDGSVVGNRCTGSVQCTMTGEGGKDLPNCTTLLKKDYKEKSKSKCPSALPLYFEDKATKKRGCTSGGLNADMTQPAIPSQPTCLIYPTLEENLMKKNSCELYRQMEEIPCFGTQCTKSITAPNDSTIPALVTVQFVDKMGMYRTAYTRKSLEYYLNHTRPKWKDDGIDLDKNVMVAEVAKAYFVDRTLSADAIQN